MGKWGGEEKGGPRGKTTGPEGLTEAEGSFQWGSLLVGWPCGAGMAQPQDIRQA